MEKQNLRIENISCGHCVMTIKNELSEIDGVVSVDGDAGKKQVTVQWNAPATLEAIRSRLEEINYPAA